MKKIMITLLLAVVLLSLNTFFGALASYGNYNNNISPEDIEFGQTDSELGGTWIAQVQFKLSAAGYFEGQPFNSGVLDNATGRAIQRYCQAIGLNFDTKVMLPRGLQSQIMATAELPKWPPEPTPTPTVTSTPFPVFTQNAYDPAIRAIQTKLADAGFFKYIGEQCEPGVLDSATMRALGVYMEQIGYKFNNVVNEDIYHIIVDPTALPSPIPTATPIAEFFIHYESSGDESIKQLQQRLEELNYLTRGQYTVGLYDSTLQVALYDFCEVNGVVINEYGIDRIMFDAIMASDAKEKKLPIITGVVSNQVQTLQQKLADLGYYRELKRSGNRCDEEMLIAVKRFADYNNIGFDGVTISESLQDEIIRSNKVWVEPSDPWATRQVSVLGITMPMYVMVIMIILILAGLTVLVIRTFSKDNPNSANGAHNMSGNGMKVELEIQYRGSYVGKCTCNIKMPLHIGRSYAIVPLDKRDMFVGKNHCQLSCHDNTLFLRDFSKNGTQINGVPVHNGEGVVHNGDILTLGEHQIHVQILR